MATDETQPPTFRWNGRTPLSDGLGKLQISTECPVVVIVGWAAHELSPQISDQISLLLRQAVIPTCHEEGAVIVTGGTDFGVMAAVGRAVTEAGLDLPLVGVAPAALITTCDAGGSTDLASLEPAHRSFLVDGSKWGHEGPALVRIAEEIAQGRGVTVLAIGGGSGTLDEIELAARRKWPTVLVTGSAGAADAVAQRIKQTTGQAPADSDDVSVAARAGCYRILSVSDRFEIGRALRWRVSADDVLRQAWTWFSHADINAERRKRPTTALAAAVVVLALATVLCALLAARVQVRGHTHAALVAKGFATALPIAAAATLAMMDRWSRAGSWIALRASAETAIREIYRYRALSRLTPRDEAAHGRLADQLTKIDLAAGGRSYVAGETKNDLGKAVQGEPVRTGTWPGTKLNQRVENPDSLLGPLEGGSYDEARVLGQICYFEKRARQFEINSTRLAVVIFLVAGAAAFALALSWRQDGYAALAACLTSIAAAMVGWREYRQRDAQAETMHRTCVALRAVRARWLADTSVSRGAPDHLIAYVDEVENSLATEGRDWQQSLLQAQREFSGRQRGS